MAEQSLSQLFTNTGTFGLPKIELDVQNEIRSDHYGFSTKGW